MEDPASPEGIMAKAAEAAHMVNFFFDKKKTTRCFFNRMPTAQIIDC